MSKKFNTNIFVENVDIAFFNQVVLKGVYISDKSNDTLVYIKKLKAQLESVSYADKRLMLKRIVFDKSRLKISKDYLNNYNYSFLYDALNSHDKEKSEWNFYCNNFKITNSCFSYNADRWEQKESQLINFNDLYLSNLNFDLKDIYVDTNSANFKINKLSFSDKSGFRVNNFVVSARIYQHNIVLNNLHLNTPSSSFNTKFFTLKYNALSDFSSFTKKVIFNVSFGTSKIGFLDLSYFIPNYKNANQSFYFSGNLKGKLNKFRAKNVKVHYGNSSYLYGNLTMTGLPELEKTFMYIDVNRLFTNKNDLETLQLYKNLSEKNIELPQSIENLGNITYNGNITGFVYDFVSYGKFNTDLGDISTDISIKTDIEKDEVCFEGRVKSQVFNLGKFVNQNKIFGNININTTIKGSVYGKNQVKATMNGTLGKIDFNKYVLKNVKVDGDFSNNKFEGNIIINDPNLKMEFLGGIDFSQKIPIFDFTADIGNANLYKLNIDKQDTLSNLSFLFIAKFKGNNFDNTEGEINIYKTKLSRKKNKLEINEILILSEKREELKHILLNSDLLDAELTGDYKPKSFVKSINNLFYFYLPVLKKDTIAEDFSVVNNLKFTINIKNVNPITKIFFPKIEIAQNTLISGRYKSENKNISLETESDKFVFLGNKFTDLSFKLNSNDSLINIDAGCKKMSYLKKYSLKNVAISSSLKHNKLGFALKWFNKDTSEYSGDIKMNTEFFKSSDPKLIAADILIPESKVVINDSVWTINKSNIKVDSSSFNFKNLLIENNNQSISLNGKISKNKNHILNTKIRNLDFSNINTLTNVNNFKIAGIMNGDIQLTNLYDSLLIDSKFDIQDIFINGKRIGNVSAFSEWDNNTKMINVNASVIDDNFKTFVMTGNIIPKTKQLDFDLSFNNTPLRILEPFLYKNLSDFSGIAQGKVKLNGLIFDPVLNGSLVANNATFTVNYLKTRYHFNDTVHVKNDTLIFDNIDVFDFENNKAVCDGFIANNNFQNWFLNLNITAKNLLAIDTKEKDNFLYYGKGYVSGLIKIIGPVKNLLFDISATTEKNTKIYLPITQSGFLKKNDFITFNAAQKSKIIKKKITDIAVARIKLNFDLHVTPDAEAFLIFDSKVGDLLRGNGYADLNMKYKDGEFNIYGDYKIENGNYLFTLQDIINKKFVIQKGSSISWNGDPYDADINIDAVYKVKKTSLYDLTLSQEDINKRYPVDCHLMMTSKLMNPLIKFKINFPTSPYIQSKSQINSLPQDELNKQILSLLLINRFQNLPGTELTTSDNNASAVGTNASELLSNQLSNWLSQISNDFDIGFSYRPGDDMTAQEYELALSTQLLNNRVSINGNVGVGGQQPVNKPTGNNTSNIVGDFMVDVKVTKSGKFHVKAFTRENDEITYDASPYTQGVGFLYREEFNTVEELFRRYWQKIFSKKKSRDFE
ncbi:MAG: translocation/assembly module TamB domain-containing protein [Bacteroidetes bacterium]|nr:translocation/assembly module TamB domain-containing protein [Bacteroidota bacterium]